MYTRNKTLANKEKLSDASERRQRKVKDNAKKCTAGGQAALVAKSVRK